MMKKILVPTDFSAVGDNAARFAIAMFNEPENEFIFFNAGGSGKQELEGKIALLHNNGGFGARQVSYHTTQNDFNLETVKAFVEKENIGLIVMGTHGENTPLAPKIFGSNTAAIMENVGVPVIAVPPDYTYKGLSRIAYAADLNQMKEELKTVVGFAREHKASVNIFHVTPIFPDTYTDKVDVHGIIDSVKQEFNFPYITYHVEETERDNQIRKGIDNFLQEHPSDLLVLFHISRSWIDKIISPSSAASQLSHIQIPIMIFPKKL